MSIAPPKAERRPVETTLHGHNRIDPYAWLRAENWQAVMRDPTVLAGDIRAHLESENAYADAILAPVADLRRTLFEEMKARIKEDDSSVPAPDGPYDYYVRHETGGQQPVFCRRPRGADAPEEILLHGDREAADKPFYRIAACRHSPDHRLLAWTVDEAGSEFYTLHVRDLETGAVLPDRIGGMQGDFVWANDGRTLFYTELDDSHRPRAVRRHRVGDDPTTSTAVYEEADPGFFVGVGKTESRRWILVEAHDHTTAEVRLIDADRPEAAPVLVAPRDRDVDYDIAHDTVRDRFLILTNAGGAEDSKIVEAPCATPGRAHWRDLVPHVPGRLIRAQIAFRDRLVRLEREDGLPRLVVMDLATGAEHRIAFDEEAYELGASAGHEYDTTVLRFSYASMTTPERIYDYDMATRDRVLRKEQDVPSGHDPSRYVTHRMVATAPDGERVPISLLHRADLPMDGSAPLLLYGYGSYGMSMPAAFGTTRLSLVDRGFVYAIAHVRGGMERGYRWYREGRGRSKRNSFTDFVAAAEHLIDAGVTRAGRIAAHGGSAGGMLVGAVANMRPDLFGAILAEVPFVDVLNTMSDPTLPLTPPEWPEWGNPIEDAEAYRYILSYTPYENVEAAPYPAILATAGLTDPRVTYWEPAKWVARLRKRTTGTAPILLRTNMTAGHAGAAGRFDKLEEVALVYAFALMVLDGPSAR